MHSHLFCTKYCSVEYRSIEPQQNYFFFNAVFQYTVTVTIYTEFYSRHIRGIGRGTHKLNRVKHISFFFCHRGPKKGRHLWNKLTVYFRLKNWRFSGLHNNEYLTRLDIVYRDYYERNFALVFLHLATRKLLNVSHRARLPKNRKSKKNAHNMITIKYRAFMARWDQTISIIIREAS